MDLNLPGASCVFVQGKVVSRMRHHAGELPRQAQVRNTVDSQTLPKLVSCGPPTHPVKTFKAIVNEKGAHWDQENKYVRASDDLWHMMIKKNKFPGAYYYHDEPIYPSLACLFGMDDIKVEGEVEVIEISDNTIKIISDDTLAIDMDANDEEVNSPAVFRRPNVKRKLFDEEEMPTNMESSTDSAAYFIDLVNAGQLPTRVE
ncbi:hypothetical protein SASPL_135844 [Salvia splendens]|uniref:Uncharacterized protein n=1 Tax=Salvia splendens TaxID=180675 RepID=A0A8X8ZGC2_SALSN|nr:hypothetical protein SASPL_135844 [Salvia splendens]